MFAPMVKPLRQTKTEDRSTLERRIESLERENAELRARLEKGPSDETWFTPGVLGLLFLGLFAAAWVRYAPPMGRRAHADTAAADAGATGEYNPPAR